MAVSSTGTPALADTLIYYFLLGPSGQPPLHAGDGPCAPAQRRPAEASPSASRCTSSAPRDTAPGAPTAGTCRCSTARRGSTRGTGRNTPHTTDTRSPRRPPRPLRAARVTLDISAGVWHKEGSESSAATPRKTRRLGVHRAFILFGRPQAPAYLPDAPHPDQSRPSRGGALNRRRGGASHRRSHLQSKHGSTTDLHRRVGRLRVVVRV